MRKSICPEINLLDKEGGFSLFPPLQAGDTPSTWYPSPSPRQCGIHPLRSRLFPALRRKADGNELAPPRLAPFSRTSKDPAAPGSLSPPTRGRPAGVSVGRSPSPPPPAPRRRRGAEPEGCGRLLRPRAALKAHPAPGSAPAERRESVSSRAAESPSAVRGVRLAGGR